MCSIEQGEEAVWEGEEVSGYHGSAALLALPLSILCCRHDLNDGRDAHTTCVQDCILQRVPL